MKQEQLSTRTKNGNRHSDTLKIIHYRKRGWINVGRTRMVLFDILKGFYNLRRVLDKEVGENASYLIFQAGLKGGYSFVIPMIKTGRISPDAQGFTDALSIYSDGGFGDFRIQEMDWASGYAYITCDCSFEGWIYRQNMKKTKRPSCDYTRGIILSFMQATHYYSQTGLANDLDCIEVSCLAAGHNICQYIVAPKERILSLGYECSVPKKSIRSELEKIVQQKTRELKNSNHFYKLILNNALVGIFTVNSNGIITSINSFGAKIMGIKQRSLLNKSVIYHGDRNADFISYLKKGLQGQTFEVHNLPFEDHNNKLHFITLKGIPLRNSNGIQQGLLCIMEDTTQNTLNIQNIEYLKKYNDYIIQSITDGIMVVDSSFEIRVWNRKMEEMFEIKAEKVLGKNLKEIKYPTIIYELLDEITRVIRMGVPIENRKVRINIKRKGERIFNRKIVPLLNENKEVIGIIVVHEDITDKERIEISYKKLFQSANDGIFVMDKETHFLSANEMTLKMLEIEFDELKNCCFFDFLSSEQHKQLKEKIKAVLNGQDVKSYEIEIITSSNKKIPVEISLTSIKEGKEVIAIQVIMRDLSDRKKMEKELIQKSKLSAIGELASGMAHEINNPLATVAGYTEELLDFLDKKHSLKPQDLHYVRECLFIILEHVDRCKHITRSLLNFVHPGEYEVREISINELIKKTITLIKSDNKLKKINIKTEFEVEPYKIRTDPWLLHQVFLNILKNAVDAVGPEGTISIRTKYNEEAVHIEIQDNGIGMSDEVLRNIFQPFFTTKPPGVGTGLGLYICYNIVEKLGGSITVNSTPGGGTTFVVKLPATS